MKKQILTALILGSLSISAFALPSRNPQPLLSEKQDSSVKAPIGLDLKAEGGGDRSHERQKDRLRVAEGGGDNLSERPKS